MPVGSRRRVDDVLIGHIAAGVKVEKAAQLAGVSRATAFRRLADPTFRRRVAEARGDALQRAYGTLADASQDAAASLRKLLKSGCEKIRVAAAKVILDQSVRVRDAVDLSERIAALEERARGKR